MVKYLSFYNSSFALRYFLMQMARPWCDTPLVHISFMHYTTNIGEDEKTKEVQGTRILYWKAIWMFVCSNFRRWKRKFFKWSFSCGSIFCKSVLPELSMMFCNWQMLPKLSMMFCNWPCFQNWAWCFAIDNASKIEHDVLQLTMLPKLSMNDGLWKFGSSVWQLVMLPELSMNDDALWRIGCGASEIWYWT